MAGHAEQRPMLLAYRELKEALPFAEFVYWLLAAAGFITLLLWLALGRWLTYTVRRLESLDHALDAYAEQAPRSIVEGHLLSARERPDEINGVADAITELAARWMRASASRRSTWKRWRCWKRPCWNWIAMA
jgi:HAMP domain-containing protein